MHGHTKMGFRVKRKKEMEHFQSNVSIISAGNTRENTRKNRLHDGLDWLAFTAAAHCFLLGERHIKLH